MVRRASGTLTYGYDELDRLVSFTDPVGSTALSYNNFGAFRSVLGIENGPWANDNVNYNYTSHKLTSITLGSWWESIGYDSALRRKTFASPAGTFTYNFNGAGMQVESLTMPQNTETYTYNAVGALKLKQFKKGGTVLDSHDYGYNPDEMIQDVTRLGGVKVDYGYDNIGQLTSAKGKEADGTTLRLNEQLGYGYDASHNLAVRTNATLIQTFTSDSRNQLASVVRNGTLTSAGSVVGAVATLGVNGKQAAIYGDKTFATTEGLTLANGTNVFVTTGSNSAGALVISTLEKAVLPVTVNCTYDLNGNITSDGLKGFEYDDANQLTRITQTNAWKSEFAYDGLGRRRIQRDYSYLPASSSYLLTNEVRYVYDGMAVLQERDGNNAELVTYTRGLDLSGTMQGAGGIGGLLARTEHSATSSLLASSSYYHSDAGGNITAMTDSSGNVVAKYLYDPFGNLLAKSGAMADVNRYRFSSKEVHLNSGSYYYGYRFYEPNFQRWLNPDPIREEGGMNLYRFVDNDPINSIDLFGLKSVCDSIRKKITHVQEKIGQKATKIATIENVIQRKIMDVIKDEQKLDWDIPGAPPSETVKGHLDIIDNYKRILAGHKGEQAALIQQRAALEAELAACLAAEKKAGEKFGKKCLKFICRKTPLGLILAGADVAEGGVVHAANEFVWPLSELWTDSSPSPETEQ